MNLHFVRQLREGGCGLVWLAEDLFLTKRRYAVKFFKGHTKAEVDGPAATQGRKLGEIDHPNVVRVISVENQDHPELKEPTLAVIMEYIDGIRLDDHRGLIARDRAAKILADLAAGLEALHRAGLVHEDLGERNVMLTSEGAKLIDPLCRFTRLLTGSGRSQRLREEDVQDLAKVYRIILENVPDVEDRALKEAFYQGSKCTTLSDLLGIFSPLVAPSVTVAPSSALPEAEIGDLEDAMFEGPWSALEPPELSLKGQLRSAGVIAGKGARSRWTAFLATVDPELLEAWTTIAKSLQRAGKARILAAMWSAAVKARKLPYLAELDTALLDAAPSIYALESVRSARMQFWSLSNEEPFKSVGPRAQARVARFGWTAGGWDPAYPLAAPFFELLSDALGRPSDEPDLPEPPQLHLWSAAGGLIELAPGESAFFPWPTLQLPTFASYRFLEGKWNTGLAMAWAQREHLPRDEHIVDALAHYYVECHHSCWPVHTAEAEWDGNLDQTKWSSLRHLVQSAKNERPGSRSFSDWVRCLPLLAAPESGLSGDAASSILATILPDDEMCWELRDLRRKRATLSLGRQDVGAILQEIDEMSPLHSWSETIEDRL